MKCKLNELLDALSDSVLHGAAMVRVSGDWVESCKAELKELREKRDKAKSENLALLNQARIEAFKAGADRERLQPITTGVALNRIATEWAESKNA